MWSEGSFGWKKKKTPERRKAKGDESKYEERVCRCGWSERRLTGGTQLADHRGSCDAGVASVMSQQSRKLTLHCPFVPLNCKYTARQMVRCHSTGDWTLLTVHVKKQTKQNKQLSQHIHDSLWIFFHPSVFICFFDEALLRRFRHKATGGNEVAVVTEDWS